MKFQSTLVTLLIIALSFSQLGMSRRGQYDEEARQAEREGRERKKQEARQHKKNPARQFATGVKEAAVDGTTGLLSETAEETQSQAPIVGTLEGARKGSEKLLDKTVKGAAKVATLGYGEVDQYEVIEPESGTDQPTKIKIKIPGT